MAGSSISSTAPHAARRRRRHLALSILTVLFVLGPAATASAQFFSDALLTGIEPGVVFSEQHTFQAPSTNLLDRLTPTRKTVTIPIHRTFATEIGGQVGSFPVDVAWSIGAGPAGTLSASPKEVEYASGTVHFTAGQRDAEIAVTLLGQPADGQPRQFTLNLDGVTVPSLGDQPYPWQNWWYYQRQGRELYRVERSGYAQTVTAPPSFNCELRDRMMSIQIPADGDATWCPERHPGFYRWTHPIMVNGIRLEPFGGSAFTFNQEQHILSTGTGLAVPRLRCSSCQSGLDYAATAISWTSDNSGPEKSLKLGSGPDGGPPTLFGFALGALTISPIKFTDSYSALLPASLRFPEQIRRIVDYTTQVIFRSQNPTGLVLDELHVHADFLPFGRFTIRPFDLYYNAAENLWTGHVGVTIPTKPGAAALRQQTTTQPIDLRTADPNFIEKTLKVTSSSPGVLQYAQDKLSDFFLQDSISVDAKLGITGAGELRQFEAGIVFSPPIPLGTGGIGLYSLRAGWQRPFSATVGPFFASGPEGLFGTIGISAGPKIGKYPAFTFDGTLGYVAADPATGTGWQLLATGTPRLFGYELASGGLRYINGQSVTARFQLAHNLAAAGFELGFNAELEATVFFDPLDFFALAGGNVRIKTPDIPPPPLCFAFCIPVPGLDINVSGGAAVNKNGFSVCANGSGLRYSWGDQSFDVFLGCSNDLLRSEIGAASAAARAAAAGDGSREVTVKRGVPYEVLQLRGRAGAPEVRIDGPGGLHFVTPARRNPLVGGRRRVRFLQAPGNVTWVQIVRPRAGTYRVTPIRRTSIASLAHASGLADPVVRATVTGRGAGRTLHYGVRQDRSQTVTLVENAGQASRVIRTVRGNGSGTLRFRPMAALARGRRTITALAQTRGTPAARRTLARFAFSEPRVRAPKLSRRTIRGQVRVAWTPVAYATGYELTITLADGQRLFVPTPARQRALRLGSLASRQNGTVSIRAVDRMHRRGPESRMRYRAASG